MNCSMSAASASAAIAATPQQGQAVPSGAPSASRPIAKKRGVVPTRSSGDGAPDAPTLAPYLPPSRPARRSRDVATTSANGDTGADLTPLGQQKDVNQTLHGEHQVVPPQQTKQKIVVLPAARGSPLKQRAVKHALHKDGHVVARRRPSSIWDVAGHFFSRFFVIFVLGAGLGTSVWNWKTTPQISLSTGLISTEVEKLEEFVAKTTKWMQVQLEVVDMKVGQEVGNLRKELHNDLDSQMLHFGTEMRNFKDNLEKIGVAVDTLYNQEGPLTKEEAFELIKTVVDGRAAKGEGHALSLDDVRASARQVVMRELERHSADGIGRVDYALGSGGGRVIAHSEPYFLGRGMDWRSVLKIIPGSSSRRHPLAEKILQPSFGEPGQCFPLKGSDVWVDIALRTTILPDAITLEHVSKDVAYDVSSAPMEFRVFGWLENRGHDRVEHPVTQRPLGEFKYDVEKTSVQTFPFAEHDVAGVLTNVIRLHVLSNSGSPGHTCIYRVRVHGSEPALALAPV